MASTWWGQLSVPVNNGTAHVDNSSCFSATQSTVLKGVNFGGVPIVLLLDFIVFLVLLLAFTVIRRRLWDYGRLALVTETEGDYSKRHYRRMTSSISIEEPDYEKGCCSWVTFIISMDESTVQERCGVDAVHYLSFQKHLVTLLLLICVLSVAVILPVNLSGDLLGSSLMQLQKNSIWSQECFIQ